MPREYEPLLFDRSKFPTYRHYREFVESLTVSPGTICSDFLYQKVESTRDSKVPRVHSAELYREFLLWVEDYEGNFTIPTMNLFSRYANGALGHSIQSWYSASYYPGVVVSEPISQSLIKLYGLDRNVHYQATKPEPYGIKPLIPACCPKCNTELDYSADSETMECLVCFIEDRKERNRPLRKKSNRLSYLRRKSDLSNLDS